MVKNPSVSAGVPRLGFDPWVEQVPWSRKWKCTPVRILQARICLENAVDKEAWQPTVHGSQRAGHDRVTEHTHVHTSTHTRVRTHRHMCVSTCMHTCTCSTHMHTDTHARVHTNVCAHVHAHTYTCTCAHTHTHMHTHTDSHQGSSMEAKIKGKIVVRNRILISRYLSQDAYYPQRGKSSVYRRKPAEPSELPPPGVGQIS